MEFLKGKKTKVVIVLTLVYAVIGLILGELEPNVAYAMILGALGGFGIYDKIERNSEE